MSQYKVTWHFSVGNLAARESLYWSNAASGLPQCVQETVAISKLRLAMLSRPFELDGVSIDGIPSFGQQRMLYDEIDANRVGKALGAQCDNPNAVFYIRFSDGTHKWHREYHVHGLPPDVSRTNLDLGIPIDLVGAKWDVPLKAWLKALGAQLVPGPAVPATNWSLLARGQADLTNLPRTKILAVSMLAAGQPWQIIVAADFAVAKGDKVHIQGASGCGYACLDGDAIVTKDPTASVPPAPVGKVLTLNRIETCPNNAPYNGRADLYKIVKNMAPLKFAFPSRVTNVRLGKAEFAHSGKAKPKSCCS